MIRLPESRGSTSGQETRTAITALASNVELVMSELYLLLRTVGESDFPERDRLVQLVKAGKTSFGYSCEALIPFLQLCHGIVQDFILLHVKDAAIELDKQTDVRERFVQGILSQIDDAVGRAQSLQSSFSGVKLEISSVQPLFGDEDHGAAARLAIESAKSALDKITSSLASLEVSWKEDGAVLLTLFDARLSPETSLAKRRLGSVSHWKEYQKIVVDAEESILRSADATHVDPPELEGVGSAYQWNEPIQSSEGRNEAVTSPKLVLSPPDPVTLIPAIPLSSSSQKQMLQFRQSRTKSLKLHPAQHVGTAGSTADNLEGKVKGLAVAVRKTKSLEPHPTQHVGSTGSTVDKFEGKVNELMVIIQNQTKQFDTKSLEPWLGLFFKALFHLADSTILHPSNSANTLAMVAQDDLSEAIGYSISVAAVGWHISTGAISLCDFIQQGCRAQDLQQFIVTMGQNANSMLEKANRTQGRFKVIRKKICGLKSRQKNKHLAQVVKEFQKTSENLGRILKLMEGTISTLIKCWQAILNLLSHSSATTQHMLTSRLSQLVGTKNRWSKLKDACDTYMLTINQIADWQLASIWPDGKIPHRVQELHNTLSTHPGAKSIQGSEDRNEAVLPPDPAVTPGPLPLPPVEVQQRPPDLQQTPHQTVIADTPPPPIQNKSDEGYHSSLPYSSPARSKPATVTLPPSGGSAWGPSNPLPPGKKRRPPKPDKCVCNIM